jgi:tRNA(Ile)-lysidine synthase
MITTYGPIPREVGLALSGGCDSMAVLDYLLLSRRKVTAIHVDHGDEYSAECVDLVTKYCKYRDVPLYVSEPIGPKPMGMSEEMWWRQERYEFLRHIQSIIDLPIITAHNLDDQVETWLMSMIKGTPKLIPSYRDNPNIIRPFLLTRKESLRDWCIQKAVPFLDDPENDNWEHERCYTRHHLVSAVTDINPGIHRKVAKLVRDKYGELSR